MFNIARHGCSAWSEIPAQLGAKQALNFAEIRTYVDEAPEHYAGVLAGLPIIALVDAALNYPGATFVAAIGSPAVRKRLVGELLRVGLKPTTLVHRGCAIGPRVQVGDGVVICAGTTITTDVVIGDYVQINLHCTIGHDAELDPYATLAPGVHVSGRVQIGDGTYLGTGAVVINGSEAIPLRIGNGATIGAGAVVTKNVPAGETWVGVPARAK